jgi:hypothetical protein
MTDTIVVTTPMVAIAAGPRGPAGADGSDGTNGINGAPGTQGGRLTLSGGNLVLVPWNGNQIIVNNQGAIIPGAGVSLPATGTSPNVSYYIYAVDSDGDGIIDALEPSGIAPVTDPTSGVRAKPGVPTRSLVGQARTIAGPAWTNTVTQRFVRSWLNREQCYTLNSISGGQIFTSTVFVEMGTSYRQEALIWADEIWNLQLNGYVQNSVNLAATKVGIMIDGVHQSVSGTAGNPASGQNLPFHCGIPASLSEGYHIASVSVSCASGSQGTIVFDGGATSTLKGFIR